VCSSDLTEETLLGAFFDVRNPMKVGESPASSEATRQMRMRRTSASDRLQRHRHLLGATRGKRFHLWLRPDGPGLALPCDRTAEGIPSGSDPPRLRGTDPRRRSDGFGHRRRKARHRPRAVCEPSRCRPVGCCITALPPARRCAGPPPALRRESGADRSSVSSSTFGWCGDR
jgi:hypothetical protein